MLENTGARIMPRKITIRFVIRYLVI